MTGYGYVHIRYRYLHTRYRDIILIGLPLWHILDMDLYLYNAAFSPMHDYFLVRLDLDMNLDIDIYKYMIYITYIYDIYVDVQTDRCPSKD